jgi:hypothetical protein
MLTSESHPAGDRVAHEISAIGHVVNTDNSQTPQLKLDLSTKAETLEYARAQIELGRKWCQMRLNNFSLSPDARWPLLNASTTIEAIRYSALPLNCWQAAVEVVRHSLRISHHREALENAEHCFANADRGW